MLKRGCFKLLIEKSKGQSSLEFLMIMGVAMIMILPLIVVFFQQSQNFNQEIISSQSDKIASEIRDAADEVYYLGAPSKKTITIYMPEGVEDVSLDENRIILTIDSPSGDYQLVKWCSSNLSGTIRDHEGIHVITAEAYDDYVLLSDN